MEPINDLFQRFEQLNAIGVALSSERNIDRLLENILLAAKAITHADGGTLYRVGEDRQSLRFEIVRTDSLNIAYGGTTGEPISAKFQDLPLYRENGEENNTLVAAYSAIHASTVNIADAYAAEGFDFSGTRKFDQVTGYRSQSFLTVPMKNHENEVIGVLQLINAIDPASRNVCVFSDADQRLAESLASQAAIALTNRLLISQLEELFEAFITLINLAIDEKSPYTGGHCQRVPSLTMMLAEAVDATRDGPMSSFRMSDKDRYELKIAGLLHDCGKVTTPVHVVDKATKLQTIFDRIQMVDTRFEVIRRDAELAMLRDVSAGADRVSAEQAWHERQRAIDDDRDFLRRVNVGGESMKAEDQERVRRISKTYRWVDGTGTEIDFLTDDEVENLTIRAGTLTQAERETINYHIVATIKMLESLPWPKHLKRVPEYAGGHHERMDGKGYPRGLKRDEMSVQARIMGIADIFEALTARDRPYKPGMKLSQALHILSNFRKNGHIDPDLFDVFIKQKVYLRYAEQYLEESQIDDPEASLAI
ncbi:HD family phosphohydrolase [Propionivibrio sp.]|uniref:HD family phosphohydrolase n=1 Tax=Propionivibrio sp. TaxID=2212460 RepID=UPI0025F3508C|nr:HD family phosphohydrolase [Propionivibrio sp.]MBK7354624.1 GAF domain-containing protein [Propionivibrio sp.]MBK8401993.1 GAF domain-containing protein [Propionivibrio sp.]MBK8743806.1 GAF domain-containing protein [Propionivibrio sp.]MBK8895456.1 GAF domain-containing protein [Propionivibrio sp.]MBL0206671.1 GAF domain-containing protein [Propionivibrio sp.]